MTDNHLPEMKIDFDVGDLFPNLDLDQTEAFAMSLILSVGLVSKDELPVSSGMRMRSSIHWSKCGL